MKKLVLTLLLLCFSSLSFAESFTIGDELVTVTSNTSIWNLTEIQKTLEEQQFSKEMPAIVLAPEEPDTEEAQRLFEIESLLKKNKTNYKIIRVPKDQKGDLISPPTQKEIEAKNRKTNLFWGATSFATRMVVGSYVWFSVMETPGSAIAALFSTAALLTAYMTYRDKISDWLQEKGTYLSYTLRNFVFYMGFAEADILSSLLWGGIDFSSKESILASSGAIMTTFLNSQISIIGASLFYQAFEQPAEYYIYTMSGEKKEYIDPVTDERINYFGNAKATLFTFIFYQVGWFFHRMYLLAGDQPILGISSSGWFIGINTAAAVMAIGAKNYMDFKSAKSRAAIPLDTKFASYVKDKFELYLAKPSRLQALCSLNAMVF